MTVIALLLVVIMTCLAVAMANFTSLSLAQSDSLQKVTGARLAAESGLAFLLYQLRHQQIPPGSSGQVLLDRLAESFGGRFDGTETL